MEQTFDLDRWGQQVTVRVKTAKYPGGGLAVRLLNVTTGEPYGTVSTNVDGVDLAEDEFIAKDYSENEGLVEAMVAAGIVEIRGQLEGIGPICRLLDKD